MGRNEVRPHDRFKAAAKALLPTRVRRWVRDRLQGTDGQLGMEWEHFCSFRRVDPFRRDFGSQSGRAVDRHYIEGFLARHAEDVRGRVLEVADDRYTRRFGGNRVIRSDVLHVTPGTPGATIIGDLGHGHGIPAGEFDCVILTQTLQYVYDTRAAIQTLYRILRPGGVALATVPGISQIARYDMDHWGEYWRFTTLSARTLFAEVFPGHAVSVQAHGNVLTAVALMHGLVLGELREAELDHHDRDYEVIITVRAEKPSGEETPSRP